MKTEVPVAVKLGGFALALVAVFAAAWGAGRLTGPGTAAPGQMTTGGHGDGHTTPTAVPTSAVDLPGGLQVAQDGYRLDPITPQLSTQDSTPFQFRILGPDGTAVTRYVTAHDKDLHLIVVRRDMTGFQHVHPSLGSDGVWSIQLRVATSGAYRVFADFQPRGLDKGLILGADVAAPGDYQPQPMPDPAREATVDGYTVRVDGDLLPGTASKLTLTVSKHGTLVTDLQPYLAAFGHLVALRSGDLAYLHVHPEESKTAGPRIVFYAEVPSDGAYRLFLDFRHDGVVRTAEFTMHAGDTHKEK